MRIFLCWSGERSRHVASALETFFVDLNGKFMNNINCRLFEGKPSLFETFRSENIEKGLLWFQAVEKELAEADAALLSITPENADSPWIHYEAGAIANRLLAKPREHGSKNANKTRLFTYLFGIEARDLRGPLAAYQSTTATFEDSRTLVKQLLTLAADLQTEDDSEKPALLNWGNEAAEAFRLCWNKFASQTQSCRTQLFSDVIGDFEERFRRLTFLEPVALCHRQAWIDRIKGCHEVYIDLQRYLDKVRERCRPYEAELYQQLLAALDGYEMTMHAYLANPRKFELGERGKLNMPEDVEWVCEYRRHVVLDAVAVLTDPKLAPVFEESPAFARLETFAGKKNAIHRKAAAIRRWMWLKKEVSDATGSSRCEGVRAPAASDGNITQWSVTPVFPGADEFDSASESDWDFDRVVYYITHIESLRQGLSEEAARSHKILTGRNLENKVVRCLQEEIEKIRAKQRPVQARPVEQLQQSSADATARNIFSEERQSTAAHVPSRIPLYYALGVVRELVEKGFSATSGMSHGLDASTVADISEALESIKLLEQGPVSQVRQRAEELLHDLEKGKVKATTA
jgi:hypothetical protein